MGMIMMMRSLMITPEQKENIEASKDECWTQLPVRHTQWIESLYHRKLRSVSTDKRKWNRLRSESGADSENIIEKDALLNSRWSVDCHKIHAAFLDRPIKIIHHGLLAPWMLGLALRIIAVVVFLRKRFYFDGDLEEAAAICGAQESRGPWECYGGLRT